MQLLSRKMSRSEVQRCLSIKLDKNVRDIALIRDAFFVVPDDELHPYLIAKELPRFFNGGFDIYFDKDMFIKKYEDNYLDNINALLSIAKHMFENRKEEQYGVEEIIDVFKVFYQHVIPDNADISEQQKQLIELSTEVGRWTDFFGSMELKFARYHFSGQKSALTEKLPYVLIQKAVSDEVDEVNENVLNYFPACLNYGIQLKNKNLILACINLTGYCGYNLKMNYFLSKIRNKFKHLIQEKSSPILSYIYDVKSFILDDDIAEEKIVEFKKCGMLDYLANAYEYPEILQSLLFNGQLTQCEYEKCLISDKKKYFSMKVI